MTVCPRCNGKGKVPDYVAERNCHGEWETVLREIPCDKCQRKPMTNEEWFTSLSTEEKAEVLFDIWYDGKVLAWDKAKPFYFNRFVAWLKEVHKDEVQ